MENLTAEKFYKKSGLLGDMTPLRIHDGVPMNGQERIHHLMVEYAKYHVKLALKAKVKAMIKESEEDSSFSLSELDTFTKDSYPLENIK